MKIHKKIKLNYKNIIKIESNILRSIKNLKHHIRKPRSITHLIILAIIVLFLLVLKFYDYWLFLAYIDFPHFRYFSAIFIVWPWDGFSLNFNRISFLFVFFCLFGGKDKQFGMKN